MNRRKFLQTGLASSLFIGSGAFLRGNTGIGTGRVAKTGGRARNVIFLISDGMSSGTFSLADQFIRWRDGRPSNWVRLYQEQKARRGLVETASANSIVTDSAAAASALGGGMRVNNGALNIGPNGERPTPILSLAREVGKATGLVTTATATHATPAGFSANVGNRSDEPSIAVQYLERRIDLVFGGGLPFFARERRKDGRDLLGDFAKAGYDIVRTQAEMERLRGADDPVLGLFADGHLPYELDRLHDRHLRQTVPGLADMTRFALERLNRRPEGFVVMIEGGRVDHAAHANDIGALIYEQVAFDQAVGVAVDFAERHRDTLVIMTTDHGNANPGLASGGDGGEKTFGALAGFQGTHGSILSKIGKESSAGEIASRIREVTGLRVSQGEGELLRAHFHDEYRTVYRRMNSPGAILGQILANHTDIGWVGNAHTSDHVEAAALGPGSEALLGFQKNTDLFSMMAAGLGIGQAVGVGS